MEPFLEKVARYLVTNKQYLTPRVAIVFPNRRAGLFLKKYLAHLVEKTVWVPATYSIEDFIIELSGFKIADPSDTLFDLFDIYRNSGTDEETSFDDFLGWGNHLLDDFNEIDQYLVDSSEIFGFLTERQALSLWHADGSQLSPFEIKYLRFYNCLGIFYQQLTQKMFDQGKVTKGFAYRHVAENINRLIRDLRFHHVIFAGFNAFTLAEKEIIQTLVKSGKATTLWDADEYYLLDQTQEAGNFMRDTFSGQGDLSDIQWVDSHFKDQEKIIDIIGIAQQIGQVKAAGQIIENLQKEGKDLNSTALVLGKEDMLIPVLNSIPANIKEFNVTMGLPLHLSPLFGLLDALITLHITSENLFRQQKESYESKFYLKDLKNFFQHPYIKELEFSERINGNSDFEKIALNFYGQTQSFFTIQEVKKLIFQQNENLFEPFSILLQKECQTVAGITDACLSLINLLKEYFPKPNKMQKENMEEMQDFKIEMEYLYTFSILLHDLKDIVQKHEDDLNLKSFHQLFRQQVAGTKLPFYGEPLKGVQIMGMLETRNLDFKNLIILNMNEDIIPAGKTFNSFIPIEIKRKFGLPTYRERNAVFAYHFYRVLQRAENITLIYNTEPQKTGGGDKSRFINQLLYELPKYNPKIIIREKVLSISSPDDEIQKPIVIPKTKELLEKLETRSKKGLSPSSLNKYRRCSLQFYFSEIARIKEPEESIEDIDNQIFGNVIHETLEQLYSPFQGQIITEISLKKMKTQSENALNEAFTKHFPGGDLSTGRNHLLHKIGQKLIDKVLQSEHDFISELEENGIELVLKFVEYEMKSEFRVDKDLTITLYGKADRVDQTGEIFRIIDYKTGNIKEPDFKINNWEELQSGISGDKSFQLLFYGYLFMKQQINQNLKIEPGILSLRQLSHGLFIPRLPEQETMNDENWEKFEAILRNILQELFDPEQNFEQTEDLNICALCAYAPVCLRN